MKMPNRSSFRVSRKAILVLLKNNATAMQIAAYLVIARFKHHEHLDSISSAGINALVNRLGISRKKAKDQFEALLAMQHKGVQLLLDCDCIEPLECQYDDDLPDEEVDIIITEKKSIFPPNKTSRTQRFSPYSERWKLNIDGPYVWVDSALVGVGREPVKRLKDLWRLCGDSCTRLLLLMMYFHDCESGFVADDWCKDDYALKIMDSAADINAYKASKCIPDIKLPTLLRRLVCGDGCTDGIKFLINKVNKDIGILVANVFVARQVVVTLQKSGTSNVMRYILDVKGSRNSCGDERFFCYDIDSALKQRSLGGLRKDTRHYNDYYVIAPVGYEVTVSMVNRLTYRIACNDFDCCDQSILAWLDAIKNAV